MPYNDISKAPPPLPIPELTAIVPGVAILRPLSRRGLGPGIILLTSSYEDSLAIKNGVPTPLVKWAEEGYTVVEIQAHALGDDPSHAISSAIDALTSCEKCEPKDKIGLVGASRVPPFLLFPGRLEENCELTKRCSV